MCAVCCTQEVIVFRGQYSLYVFDVQRAEQDNGVLECNCSARRVWGVPFFLGKYTRFTQMQSRKC